MSYFNRFADLEKNENVPNDKTIDHVFIEENDPTVKEVVSNIMEGDVYETIKKRREMGGNPGFNKVMRRLGYHSVDMKSDKEINDIEVFKRSRWFPEYFIVKYVNENYNQIMESFIDKRSVFTRDDAYFLTSLLEHKQGPIIPEEKDKLRKMIQENNKERSIMELPSSFIQKLNDFINEFQLGLEKAVYQEKSPDLSFYKDIDDADESAKSKADLLLRLLESGRETHIPFKDVGNFYDTVLAATERGWWHDRAREPLTHYHFLQNAPFDIKMPRDFVELQLGMRKITEYDRDIVTDGVIGAAIIDRAYKIESQLEPLEVGIDEKILQ